MKKFHTRFTFACRVVVSAYPVSALAFFCLVFSVYDIREAVLQAVEVPKFALIELGIALTLGAWLLVFGYKASKRDIFPQ